MSTPNTLLRANRHAALVQGLDAVAIQEKEKVCEALRIVKTGHQVGRSTDCFAFVCGSVNLLPKIFKILSARNVLSDHRCKSSSFTISLVYFCTGSLLPPSILWLKYIRNNGRGSDAENILKWGRMGVVRFHNLLWRTWLGWVAAVRGGGTEPTSVGPRFLHDRVL